MNPLDTLIEAFDEDGHKHFFEADALAALAAVGLIVRVGDRWTFESAAVALSQFPELAICDFCHERPVTWDVDADTFDAVLSDFTSIGGWAACEPCGQAIADGDRRALQRRTLAWAASIPNRTAESFAFRAAGLLEILELFWQHFKGVKRYATPYREGTPP